MNENEQKTTKSPIPIIFAIPFGPFLISPKTPPKENKLEIKILKIEKIINYPHIDCFAFGSQ